MNIHLISFLDKDHSQPHKLFTLCFFIGTRPPEGGDELLMNEKWVYDNHSCIRG
jgi:hypothetical protein